MITQRAQAHRRGGPLSGVEILLKSSKLTEVPVERA